MNAADVIATIDAVLKFAQIVAMVGTAAFVLFKVGRFSAALEAKMAEQSKGLAAVKEDVVEVKGETKKINTVLTELAVQSTRLNLMDERYEEIRRVVFPLPGPR